MRNMASSWMLKNREPEFQEMAEFTKTFREKMVALESVSDKIAKDRFGEDIAFFCPFCVFCHFISCSLSQCTKRKKKNTFFNFTSFALLLALLLQSRTCGVDHK